MVDRKNLICYVLITGINLDSSTIRSKRLLGMVDARSSTLDQEEGICTSPFYDRHNLSKIPEVDHRCTHGTRVLNILLSSGFFDLIPILVSGSERGNTYTGELITALNFIQNENSQNSEHIQSAIVIPQGLGFGSHDGSEPVDLIIKEFSEISPSTLIFKSSGNEAKENRHARIELEKQQSFILPFSLCLESDVERFALYYSSSSSCTIRLYQGKKGKPNPKLLYETNGRDDFSTTLFRNGKIELSVDFKKNHRQETNTSCMVVSFDSCLESNSPIEIPEIYVEIQVDDFPPNFPFLDAYAQKSFNYPWENCIRGGIRFKGDYVCSEQTITEMGNNPFTIVVSAAERKGERIKLTNTSSRGGTRKGISRQPTAIYDLSEQKETGSSYAVAYYARDILNILSEVYDYVMARYSVLQKVVLQDELIRLIKDNSSNNEHCSDLGYCELDAPKAKSNLISIVMPSDLTG